MDAQISSSAIARWREHVGRKELRRQRLDPESLRRFAVAVGSDLDVERRPPPLAHWAWFLEAAAFDQLGTDGHPKRQGLLPAITLPRRMFASSDMRFYSPLVLNAEAELELTIAGVTHRVGRTGDLIFVDVDRVLRQDDGVRLSERQTLVYRDVDTGPAAKGPDNTLALQDVFEVWTPSSIELFRFSAATFNSHRIHYDQKYAQDEEGYPDLVVQGPQTAARLYAAACRGLPAPPSGFRFRALAPAFVNQPLGFRLCDGEGHWEAVRADGVRAMSAQTYDL